jgi:hypothetical protein
MLFLNKESDWGTLVPRINVENVGRFHLIRKYLRARYPHLKMMYNVVAFIQGESV